MHQLQLMPAKFDKVNSVLMLLLSISFVLNTGCQNETETISNKFIDIKPSYSNIQLVPKDTISFFLEKDAYNKIKSFNCFIGNDGKEYISFYDRLSESVTIYEFSTRVLIKKLQLKKIIKGKLYKTSAYVHSYDSILVTNFDKLYLLDSSGKIHRSATLTNIEAMAFFETPVPAIIKENKVFTGVRPYVNERSMSDIKDWKVLCAFDMDKDACKGYYSLPEVYRKDFYGSRFMEYGYCYNDKGNFVFSFPADSNIYETNLKEYNTAYNGKSKFQTGPIEPVGKQALDRHEGRKEFALRDSYGPIYYDPHTKRYLRIAKQKVSKEALASKTAKRTFTIIVFDEHFKIIGEFEHRGTYLLDTIFSAADGNMYARVFKSDEKAIHFVRLVWDNDNISSQLTKK